MAQNTTKIDYDELRKQLEYYLSDKNLKQDEFFHGMLDKSETKSLPVDVFLNCNKIKQSKASKDDIIKALESSTAVELLPDRTGVKRKNETIPALEPKAGKKGKYNSHEESKDEPGFKEQMFKYSLATVDEAIKWDTIQKEVEAQHGVKVSYSRLNDGHGHFAVNKFDLTDKQKEALLTGITIGENKITIEECKDQDLKDFYRDHGKHLDICLERVGLKNKRKGKKQNQFVFLNQRHHNLTNLRNTFRDILQRSTDGELLKEAEHNMVHELLKHHERYEEKAKNLKGFTTGAHPEYKNTRCFFAVKEDGSKEDFSSTKCLEKIKEKYNLSD